MYDDDIEQMKNMEAYKSLQNSDVSPLDNESGVWYYMSQGYSPSEISVILDMELTDVFDELNAIGE